jgi:hypothetical protein
LRAAERWRGLMVVGVALVGFESARRIFLNSTLVNLSVWRGGVGTIGGPDSYVEGSGAEEDVDWFCVFFGGSDGLVTGSCEVEIIFVGFCFCSKGF